ncbi:MAG: hypothetical protein GY803_21020 [Chloroflexi bacterium]|nr:hypothetical protein [Chloroflexota bacterium]
MILDNGQAFADAFPYQILFVNASLVQMVAAPSCPYQGVSIIEISVIGEIRREKAITHNVIGWYNGCGLEMPGTGRKMLDD